MLYCAHDARLFFHSPCSLPRAQAFVSGINTGQFSHLKLQLTFHLLARLSLPTAESRFG